MLMLLLAVDHQRYAIDSQYVAEVLPLIPLAKAPQSPATVAGLLQYRDRIVPVIDFCQLVRGTPCQSYLSTRIIMLSWSQGDRPPLVLGLMAEQVTQMISIAETQTFTKPDLTGASTPHLGDVVIDEQGMIQCLHLKPLITSIFESLSVLEPTLLHVSSSD